MKSIRTCLPVLCLLPFALLLGPMASASLAATPSVVERCQLAHPTDHDAFRECVLSGVKSLGPPPTDEELRAIYGEPDEPSTIRRLTVQWVENVLEHQSSYLVCKGPSSLTCMATATNKELSMHEQLMESLKPQSWPKALAERYARTYMLRMLIPGTIACQEKRGIEYDACLKAFLGRDPENLFFDGYSAYMRKAVDRLQQIAEQQDRLHALQAERRREEIEQQRTHTHALMDAYVAGQILQSFGGNGPFQSVGKTAPSPPVETPPPSLLAPSAPAIRPIPPISCSSRQVGGVVHTDCY